MPGKTIIQFRRDTAANWASVNPVLHDSELGVETDTGKAKLGTGLDFWNFLPYWQPGSALTASDVGADVAGAAGAAQAAAQSFAMSAVSSEAVIARAAEALALQKASNLADLANAATARTNLGLGNAAVASIDSTATDIRALGGQAAGASGKVADAAHVHPTTGLMTKVASTGNTAYVLGNVGVTNIVSWTAPNDGTVHSVFVQVTYHITGAATGGQLSLAYTCPDGTAGSPQLEAASQGVGVRSASNGASVQAGTTVAVTQATALTAGAAVAWADIWAV